MRLRTKHGWALTRAVLLAGIVLGCVMQQVGASLHLARHDHLVEVPGDEHVHMHGPAAHHGDGFGGHAGEQHAGEDRGGHVPHPIEDHLDDGVQQAVPPVQDAPRLVLAPVRATLPPPALPVSGRLEVAFAGPRGPPPRGAPSSRAPPSAS